MARMPNAPQADTPRTRHCRYHCPSCQAAGRPSCFTSLVAFDRHVGVNAHHSPADTLIRIDGRSALESVVGVCDEWTGRIGEPTPTEIWSLAPSEKAQDALRGGAGTGTPPVRIEAVLGASSEEVSHGRG